MLKTVATCAGLLGLLLARPAQAACATTPQLRGEPALVASVAQELARRGSAGWAGECAPLQVQLSSQGGGYLVGLEDQFGRRSERQVASVEMAATLIESWMAPGMGEPVGAPAPPVVTTVALPPASSRLVLLAQTEAALANDSSLWMGFGAMACWRLGRFCPGTLLRFADDEGWSASGEGNPGAHRSLEALLAGRMRLSLGRVHLLPRLGVGVAWTSGREPKGRHDEGPPPQTNRGWLRGEAGITGQLVLRGAWALVLDLSSELAPLVLDARMSDAHAVHEPWIFYRLGLGVTWGTP